MEKMESVLRRFHLIKEPRESDARQQLKRELFAFNKCMELGFLNKPTAMAYDSQLQLLAIGNKVGDMRIYGAAGVQFSGQHSSYAAVTHICFLAVQGHLVTVCDDSSLNLWRLDVKDGQSQLELVKSISAESSKLKVVTAVCLSTNSLTLLLATDDATIHVLDVLTFKLKDKLIQQDSLIQHAADDMKANVGKIETIVSDPTAANQFLIGFKQGLIVLWDVEENNVLQTYTATQNVESLYFTRDGCEFICSHSDGSYVTWSTSDASRPKEEPKTPYGPFPCKPITKMQLKSAAKSDPVMVFSGGMPRASYGDRHSVTVIDGDLHVVFDLTSPIIDFIVLCSADEQESTDVMDTDDAHTVLILAEEELVAIDLLSDGWPCYELPYLSSIHASAILSATHVANVPQALWDRIKAAGVSQRTICSTRAWPIHGGKDLRTDSSANDLLLTGHEDGSVRFWDVSATRMSLMYKLATSSVFGINTSPTQESPKTPDGEEEWPPFRKVGTYDPFSDDPQLGVQKMVLCCASETLCVGGTAGQVVVLQFEQQEQEVDIKVIPLVIVSDQDSYVWKGHDPLTVKVDEVKFAAGFQPTCVVQVQPPVMCTALTVNEDWQLLAVGTALGFGVVDYAQKKSVFEKCTLGPPEETATPRRRSLRKSLRESFRHLRKRRIPLSLLHRRTRTESKSGAAAETETAKPADEGKTDQPSSSSTPAAAAATEETLKKEPATATATAGDDVGAGDTAAGTEASAAPAASSSSPPASPTVTSPPMSPQRQLEARSADEMTTSVVRCLAFADTFLMSGHDHSPTLWVGTNAGTVYIHQLTVPVTDKRSTDEVQCVLSKEIQLQHRAAVVSVAVIDRAMQLLGSPLGGQLSGAKTADMSGGHQVVICSEQQIKIFSLPNLKAVGKFKLASRDGCRIRKAGVISFRSRSDENYMENDVACLTTIGDILVLSLPHLRQQMKVEGMKCDNSTVNSSPFVISGEAFFLNSPSDFVRLSLSAQRAVKPNCIVDLRDDDDALKMQLEPDTPEPVPAEEPAAGVKVVVTEDQPAPSDSADDKQLVNGEHAAAAESWQDVDETEAMADDSQLATANDTSACDVTGDIVTLHVMEESSSTTIVTSDKTVVTKTTVTTTTDDGMVTETTNMEHVNSSEMEVAEDGAAAVQ